MTKKVGILGSGQVAQVLGNGFIKHGYEVMLGTREAGKLAAWKTAAGTHAHVGTFAEAAAFGSLLVLAVKGTVAVDVLHSAGAANLLGKTILDATNPIADAPPQRGVLHFFTTLEESLMEQLQRTFTTAHFVKAFNSVGNAQMVNPVYKEGRPTMFICGNSDQAKAEARDVLTLFGWDTEDMGSVEAARCIEPLCMLWCIPGFLRNQWSHAFKLLKP